MNKEQLASFRDKQGWSQSQLAELLNASLDRKYTSGTVSQWETGKRGVPAHVASFLTTLQMEEAFPSDLRPDDSASEPPDGAPGTEDTMPPPPDSSPGPGPAGHGPGLGEPARLSSSLISIFESM